jgi:hypothetical protein
MPKLNGTCMNGFTSAARRTGIEVRAERANQKAANLAPIVKALQAAGVTSLNGIAAALNARGVSTPAGSGHWHAMRRGFGMADRATLERHLAMVHKHVERCQKIIRQRQALIERLAAGGHDLTQAKEMLHFLIDTLAPHIKHRDRLQRELGPPDYALSRRLAEAARAATSRAARSGGNISSHPWQSSPDGAG